MESLSERLNSLDGLPSPPQIAIQIVEICQDDEKGAGDLAEVLALDPAMTSRVLQIANSAAYSRGRELTQIRMAVSTLGTKTVSIVALGFSLKGALPNWQHEGGLTDVVLWRHSVSSAVAARQVARLANIPEPESAFLCGLLARIGHQVLYSAAPEEYGAVLDRSPGQLPDQCIEEELIGVTHHVAGRLMAEKWQLPRLVCETIGALGEAGEAADPIVAEYVKVVRVADAMASLLFGQDKAGGLQRVHRLAEQELGCTPGEIDRLFVSCETEIRETLDVFSIDEADKLDCAAILEAARHQLVEVSLRLAVDLTDARDESQALAEDNSALEKAARTDALTGLPNRAALDAQLDSLECIRTGSPGRPYSVIMADIDFFKKFNDTYGHAAGDEVLRVVGAALTDSARSTDFVARYGGEEFTVVITNAGRENAHEISKRYHEAIRTCRVEWENEALSVTASFGVASLDSFPPGTTAEELLEAADAALYQAKEAGRDCIVCHTTQPQPAQNP